mmetsp:Transcript_25120/g.59719  ORF Transcript_25120/g.59719 Transcript_25120/m.59719 type:complete len:113 (+) Transcript_25120:355-693(+)
MTVAITAKALKRLAMVFINNFSACIAAGTRHSGRRKIQLQKRRQSNLLLQLLLQLQRRQRRKVSLDRSFAIDGLVRSPRFVSYFYRPALQPDLSSISVATPADSRSLVSRLL